MSKPHKSIYVISDLHLGGEPAIENKGGEPATEGKKRGFRLCTREQELASFITEIAALQPAGSVELVINGDSVDFLAERAIDPPHGWKSFHYPQEDHAVALLDRIASRSKVVFDALKTLLKSGHRLVILPGNHDIELNLPKVRRRLRELVGADGPADYEFIPHGEAYLAGDVLIEHGNRIDDMNFVDQNRLRILCGSLSRGENPPDDLRFDPPVGSKLVATLMNDIKKTYSFIDLLKPEKEAALPVLLALEPGRLADLTKAVAALAKGKARRFSQQIQYRTSISALDDEAETTTTQQQKKLSALEESLLRTVGRADFGRYESSGEESYTQQISAISTVRNFASLLFGARDDSWEKRLVDLLAALRQFQHQQAFDRSQETDKIYLEEANRLAWGPVRYIVFGHTHLAKSVSLGNGRTYFNSGTWADILQLPSAILDPTREYAPLAELEGFMKDLMSQNYGNYELFHPTYVHFVQNDSGVTTAAELLDYRKAAGADGE